MEQYSILGRVGEGAHGIVFKAKHIEVTQLVHDTNFTNQLKASLPCYLQLIID